jgi:hypothetical protein
MTNRGILEDFQRTTTWSTTAPIITSYGYTSEPPKQFTSKRKIYNQNGYTTPNRTQKRRSMKQRI